MLCIVLALGQVQGQGQGQGLRSRYIYNIILYTRARERAGKVNAMAKVKKLPSGAYHTQLYIGKDEAGKRKYKSITADSPKEVRRLAAIFEIEKDKLAKPEGLTLGVAMNNYTNNRINILSPTTERNYDSNQRNYFKDIQNIPVTNLTSDHIQNEINKLAKNLAPKTVHNIGVYVKGVLKEVCPDKRFDVDFPPLVKPDIVIPDEDVMRDIYYYSRDTKLAGPIIFASTLGMRRSEILGADWQYIYTAKKLLKIIEVIVYDKNNKPVVKAPKSYAGTRPAMMPDMVCEFLERIPFDERHGRVFKMAGYQISEGFVRFLQKHDIPHFRFHDLRHYFASVMFALNIPPKYAAARMGHADETMINRVYAHIMQTREDEHTEALNNYFNGLQRKMQDAI